LVVSFGLDISFPGMSLAGAGDWFRELRDLGYDSFWTSETSYKDGFTPLALAAQATPDVRIGTCIVPVYTRGPSVLAITAAALADVAPGRFVLGIGSSSANIVEGWNGIAFSKPYARTRDTLRFLRRALTGERVDEEYETFGVHGFRLDQVPEVTPPILLAAMRPGMLRLAGREGDGAMLVFVTPDEIPKLVSEVGPGKDISCKVFLCPNAEPEAFQAAARRLITAYLNVAVYKEHMQWLGHDELTPMWDAWAAGDRKRALELVPQSTLDAYFATGSPEACWARYHEYVDAGVTMPIVEFHAFGIDVLAAIRATPPR
jgi:probable F420-dependent oxidoreductase